MMNGFAFKTLAVAILALAVLPSCKQSSPEKAPVQAPSVAPPAPPGPPATSATPEPAAPVEASSSPGAPAPAAAAPVDASPSAPEGIVARTGGAPGEIDLSWQAATGDRGVTAYEVSSGGRVVASGPATSARVAGLASGRRYCFTVRALLDASGNGSPPSAQACARTLDVTAPSTPAGLVAEARPAQVKLAWSPSTDDVGVAGYEVLRGEQTVAKTEGPSATESDLKAGTAHCYVVRAFDAAGNRSAPSALACATPPDVTPPSEPGKLEATSPSETEVVLEWKAATDDVGVAAYEISRGDAALGHTQGLRAGDTGLRAGTQHCYRVRAIDAAGNKGQPTQDACVTTLDLSPPSPPPLVAAASESQSEIRVRWEASTDNVGVARYEVQREGKVAGITQGLSVVESGLAEGRSYCYTVTAFDKAGNASTAAGPGCATIPDRTPPSVPDGVQSVANSGTQIHVAWRPSTDNVAVVGYEILRDGAVVAGDGKPRGMVTRLAPETEYCFSVRAVDAAGNLSASSAETCARTAAATALAAPTNLQAKAAGDSEVTLTWDPSPEPGVVYVVFLDGEAKGRAGLAKRSGERRIGTAQRPSIKLNGKYTLEQNCYRVAAHTPDGRASPQTLPACAKVASK